MGQIEGSPQENLPSPDVVSNTAEGIQSDIDFAVARHQTQKRKYATKQWCSNFSLVKDKKACIKPLQTIRSL